MIGAAAIAASAQEQKQAEKTETFTAGATKDSTPRVGIVLSSYSGSEDHDGTAIKGLADPQPVGADLTPAQIDAMVSKAIEVSAWQEGGFSAVVGPDDWAVIKPDLSTPKGAAGSVTDIRVVRSLISYMAEKKCGARITIADGSSEPGDVWDAYRKMAAEFKAKYPSIDFDVVDLNTDDALETPVPGGAAATANKAGSYFVPQTIQQCDKLISVAPLKTSRDTGIALSMANYLGTAPGSKYGYPKAALHKLGQADDIVLDLFSYHPADFAILGGSFGIEGDGQSVHHNLVIAGMNSIAVDVVAAAAMGFDQTKIKHLVSAERRGFGGTDIDLIWTRGNDVEQAKKEFRKPTGWTPAK